MAVNLQLVFRTAGGSRRTISVADPKEDLTGPQVQAAMESIVSKNIFANADGEFVEPLEARIVTTTIDEIALT